MTFARDLKQLTLSMDGIYARQMEKISRIIETYTEKTLSIECTTVYLRTTVDGEIALGRYKLGALSADITERIKNDKGDYNGQVFMAFDKKKPIWIICKEGRRRAIP